MSELILFAVGQVDWKYSVSEILTEVSKTDVKWKRISEFSQQLVAVQFVDTAVQWPVERLLVAGKHINSPDLLSCRFSFFKTFLRFFCFLCPFETLAALKRDRQLDRKPRNTPIKAMRTHKHKQHSEKAVKKREVTKYTNTHVRCHRWVEVWIQ